jgi:hypothetical protein
MYTLSDPEEFRLRVPAELPLVDVNLLNSILGEAYAHGQLDALQVVTKILQDISLTGELQAFRSEFYSLYNRYAPEQERPNISLVLDHQMWTATWVPDWNGPLGCFWSHQYATRGGADKPWVGAGGGPLEGNPQTEHEVRQALLKLPSCY